MWDTLPSTTSEWVEIGTFTILGLGLLMRWDRKRSRVRYRRLHRYFAGIAVLCLLITIVASVLGGAPAITISYRSFVVVLVLLCAECILIRSWSSWQDLQETQYQARK